MNQDDERVEMIWGIFVKAVLLTAVLVFIGGSALRLFGIL